MAKRKPKRYSPRFRKGDHAHNLQVAALRLVKANGGKPIVLGEIGILDQGNFKFSVCVGFAGRKPEKKND